MTGFDATAARAHAEEVSWAFPEQYEGNLARRTIDALDALAAAEAERDGWREKCEGQNRLVHKVWSTLDQLPDDRTSKGD